jgi:GntR family transcriptional regulator, rspAB operon transcriptional repressor
VDLTLASGPVERQDLRDQVHLILRAEIVQARLESGERLHVGRLADRLGVSPTPVKEALSRLAAEGLVEVGARGGTFVTRPTRASVDEIFDLREVLEQFAAARAMAVATEADLAQLTELSHSIRTRVQVDGSLAYEGFSHDDIAFYNLLVGLAGNKRLMQMYQDLHAYTIVARSYYQIRAKGRGKDSAGHLAVSEQHLAIVAAMRARNPDALRAAISTHIASVRAFGHKAVALVGEDH